MWAQRQRNLLCLPTHLFWNGHSLNFKWRYRYDRLWGLLVPDVCKLLKLWVFSAFRSFGELILQVCCFWVRGVGRRFLRILLSVSTKCLNILNWWKCNFSWSYLLNVLSYTFIEENKQYIEISAAYFLSDSVTQCKISLWVLTQSMHQKRKTTWQEYLIFLCCMPVSEHRTIQIPGKYVRFPVRLNFAQSNAEFKVGET